MPDAARHRGSLRSLALAWGLVTIGAVVLVVGYANLPERVVLYRPPWADATTGPKSFLTVGRIAVMGVGQLGAATAMVFASRGSGAWERFWRWLALVAGGKTLLECVGLSVPEGTAVERAVTSSTFALVGLFASTAVWWWSRGELRAHPRLEGTPRIWLAASLALWAVFAVAPRWFA